MTAKIPNRQQARKKKPASTTRHSLLQTLPPISMPKDKQKKTATTAAITIL
jgi:hypothetical protein